MGSHTVSMTQSEFEKLAETASDLLNASKYEESRQVWMRLLKTFPSPCANWARAAAILIGYAETFFQEKRYDMALRWYKEALKCPESKQYLHSIAFVNIRIGG